MEYERTCLDEALGALMSVNEKTAKAQADFTRQCNLKVMQNYLSRLKLDIKPLSIIHVAGTKGKGSTCAMVESILRCHGYKTGLFTSPHLISLNERFRVNGKPVEPEILLEHFWAIWDELHATKAGDCPQIAGFFRFLTLLAFRLFLRENVDVVILEVGLGGRLDATNVVQHPVVCGVTTLDLDHTHVLGNTIEQIAREKAGIFKKDVPAFSVCQEPSAEKELRTCANKYETTLEFVPPLEEFGAMASNIQLGLQGNYQRTNAALAITLATTWMRHHCGEKQTHPINYAKMVDNDTKRGLENSSWPGRSQIVEMKDENVVYYLDGAHTEKSMECCADWFRKCHKSSQGKTILLFYISHDRDVARVIHPLLQLHFDMIILCPANAVKPSFVKMPSVNAVLEKGGFGDLIPQVNGQDTAQAQHALHWQYTLKNVWQLMSRNLSSHKVDSEIRILPSIAESVQFIHGLASQDSNPLSVVVTGSLYVVGGVLQELDYTV